MDEIVGALERIGCVDVAQLTQRAIGHRLLIGLLRGLLLIGIGDEYIGLMKRIKVNAQGLSAAQLTDALGFAARAAAITCSRRGADLPRRSELN